MKVEAVIQETVSRSGKVSLTFNLEEVEKLEKLIDTVIKVDTENSREKTTSALFGLKSSVSQLEIPDFQALCRFRAILNKAQGK